MMQLQGLPKSGHIAKRQANSQINATNPIKKLTSHQLLNHKCFC
jgi:hypothetical protein